MNNLNKELIKLWTMSYYECLQYLKDKYGRVQGNYFLNESCKSFNRTIKRSNEGLFIHHDYEYDSDDDTVADLSQIGNAKAYPFKYQLAENLTYCNWLEHLILHLKINLLRKEQLGFYFNDGVVNYFIPQLNKMYAYEFNIDKTPAYVEIAFSVISADYDTYCYLVEEWLKELQVENYNWRNLR